MSMELRVGTDCMRAGYFTKAIHFRMQQATEIERRVGYPYGTLRQGYWLLLLQQLPEPQQFEFRGYSQMSGGVPMGHLPSSTGVTAEQSLRGQGVDLDRLKRKVIADVFRLSGPERLAKVVPNGRPASYPPGSGIPQWELTEPLRFRVAAWIGAGELYRGNYA